jgi:Bacterial PH domain
LTNPYAARVTGPSRAPLTWRIPAWQPALLFLIAAGCAAANAYAQVSTLVRVVTIAVGVAALAMGVAAVRMYFVVDDEGVGVRRLLRERSLDWDDIAGVSVIQRGFDTLTLRVTTHDGRYLDVPQSLLMPSRPTGKAQVRAQLGDIARQIEAYGQPYRR